MEKFSYKLQVTAKIEGGGGFNGRATKKYFWMRSLAYTNVWT